MRGRRPRGGGAGWSVPLALLLITGRVQAQEPPGDAPAEEPAAPEADAGPPAPSGEPSPAPGSEPPEQPAQPQPAQPQPAQPQPAQPQQAQPQPAQPQPAQPQQAQPQPAQPQQAQPQQAQPQQAPTPPPSSPGPRHPARTPTAPPPPPAATAPPQQEEEDDGRDVDILWLEPFGGYSYVNLVQFSQSNFFPSAERTEGNGFTVGLGAGFRLKIITLGARVSFSKYPDFDLGTVGLDLGIRIPIGAFEPYVRGGLGYAWIGAADYEEPGLSETDVFGLAGEVGAGLDIYFNSIVSIGVGLDAAFLNLTRQDVREDGARLTEINLEEDGDAVGLQLRAHAHLGLHF